MRNNEDIDSMVRHLLLIAGVSAAVGDQTTLAAQAIPMLS